MLQMPLLETARLIIRPFTMDDLDAIHHVLDHDLVFVSSAGDEPATLAERRTWLEWTVLNYDALAKLYQPPYGDRAIVLKQTQTVVGACGYVPCLGPFEQLPGLHRDDNPDQPARATAEVGLYWAIASVHQRQGYATEAARALMRYAFTALQLKRVVALTSYVNLASIGVMRKLGMRIEHNPYPEPPWLQVVGIREFAPIGEMG
jgi:ribosomal-protein-alanine N-acetyltransferase